MCAQISCLTHLTQLYFTDKAASTEVCLWAYAMCRATEAEMRKATGEESRAMYEHLLLRHAPELTASPSPLRAAPSAGRKPDRVQLQQALERSAGDRASVAAQFGISRTTLWRWLRDAGLQ